jgi:MoxR-like ATPase
LAYHVASRWPVYCTGPHGSGKSEAAKVIAKTLNIGFGYILVSPFTTESKFFGGTTLDGTVTKPDFRKCWENGGIFLADEFDNALPSLQVSIMSAIGSRDICSFPDGTIPCHPDFVFIATGNCNSWSPEPAYPGRHPFDRAFASRFKFILWEYDNSFELELARARWKEHPGDVLSIVAWSQNVRAWAKSNLPRFVPCPRETFKVVEDIAAGRPLDKVLTECFFTGLPKEQADKVLAANPFPTLRGQ